MHPPASRDPNERVDVKVVQARLRARPGRDTLDTYGHLWPDRADTSRAAVTAVHTERRESTLLRNLSAKPRLVVDEGVTTLIPQGEL
jgi:hypothetical protein